MINQANLTTEWIEQVAGEHQTDPLLTEKTIRALLLLEGLAKEALPFVFKGGTALMLHFGSGKRLSIDIDIILTEEQPGMNHILDCIVDKQGFTRRELQERQTQSSIQKEHYKLYYEPLYKTRKEEEYILLDILIEEALYANIVERPVRSSFLPLAGEPVKVNVASVDDLLGDKLTAFAPDTTGIPYYKNEDSKSMEIIKQLYDIGSLFDQSNQPNIVQTTFQRIAETELSYRNKNDLTPQDVLDDIYQTSLAIATRGQDGEANFEELQAGIKRVNAFIFSEGYHIERAITDASKSAYLATAIKHDVDTFQKFTGSDSMEDWAVEQPMNTKLNKLKKSDPEAFFYWYQVFKLKNE